MTDDGFEPKLGKMRATGRRKVRKYAGRVVVAARLAGKVTGIRNRRFDGSRIGRGAGIGRLLSSRDRFAGLRARRAVVKTRLVRLGVKGLGSAKAHLRYIQRDGVTRAGTPGELYSSDRDQADGKAFLERSSDDRHQFRFIVSAEDGAEYPDLKPYVRRLMAQAEADLGTRLDWVAVDHFNTERPHTHIMLRGVDDRDDNLIIAREYIAHGLRARAAELATLDLGPRTDREIEERLRHDVGQERLTALDRRLLRRMDEAHEVGASDRDPFRQSLAAGRLRRLAEMGLAEPLGGGRYRLVEALEDTLRRMGERGDIIRTMQRELTARRLNGDRVDRVIADESLVEPIVGRVIHRGFSDEHRDRHYLMIDGIDGRVHYIDVGRGDASEPVAEGAIVRVAARAGGARDVDRTIAAVAAANGGHYSVDLHLRHDPDASEAFAEAHVRRLEAMRRAKAGVERRADGSWIIASDHVVRAAGYEQRLVRERPVDITILSRTPIAEIATVEAATWLDRALAAGSPPVARDAGFGREVRQVLAARRQWLVEQQLADVDGASVRFRSGAIAALQRRELLRVASQIADDLGKPFAEARTGDVVDGRLARVVDVASGRLALVENSREFTLVPWRPLMAKQLGKQASGIMRADGISFRIGRERPGPERS